jgi:hypothetical protein
MATDQEGSGKQGAASAPAGGSTSKVVNSGGKLFNNLAKPTRILLTLVAAILIAVLLLWLIDKFVLYYLAQTYVGEVAKVLDLNVHLANALILITFIVAVFFARLLWSFSRQKRLIGVVGISALLIGHSLVLWYATRDQPFGQALPVPFSSIQEAVSL